MSTRRELLEPLPEGAELLARRGSSSLALCGFVTVSTWGGLALEALDQGALRVAYITVFLLILVYAEVPWTGVLLDWTLR